MSLVYRGDFSSSVNVCFTQYFMYLCAVDVVLLKYDNKPGVLTRKIINKSHL